VFPETTEKRSAPRVDKICAPASLVVVDPDGNPILIDQHV